MKNYEYFICFRGDASLGGAVGQAIYNTLYGSYGKSCYFSSCRNRVYGTNYRLEEEKAIENCDTFIIVLTCDFIDKLSDNDEVLFELKKVLSLSNKKIIAVAHKEFLWTEARKKLLEAYLGEDAKKIYFIDYIEYEGNRKWGDYTEGKLLETLNIEQVKNIVYSVQQAKEKLIEIQLEKLKKQHSGLIFLNAESIINNCYIEPNLLLNGTVYDGQIENEIIAKSAKKVSVICGKSGQGKSTLLYKTFLSVCDMAKTKTILPIYKSLNKVKDFSLDFTTTILDLIKENELNISKSIVDELVKTFKPVYFLDALDEKSEDLSFSTVQDEIIKCNNSYSIIITMRDTCFKAFASNGIINEIDNLFTLVPYAEETIGKYCFNFLTQYKQVDSNLATTITEKLKKQKIFGNILILTYYLYAVDIKDLVIEDVNIVSCLLQIIKELIERESEKGKITCDLDKSIKILKEIAFQMYIAKGRRFLKKDKIESVVSSSLAISKDIVSPILSLFTSEQDDGALVFIHEMFKEFTIAKDFCDRLLDGDDLLFMLDYTYNKEINVFISQLFAIEGVSEVFEGLKDLYNSINDGEYVRYLAVLNHMHRLNMSKSVANFVREKAQTYITGEKTELNETMKILLMHSLLACGTEEDEKAYYSEFVSDRKFALLNCGMALRYYNDDRKDIEIPYYDDGEISWQRCFEGYKIHLLNKDNLKHYYRIRRINILSSKTFIEVRRCVSEDVANFFYSINDMLVKDDSEFGKLVYQAYLELISVIERYK